MRMDKKVEIIPIQWLAPERKKFKRCKAFKAQEKKRLQVLRKKEFHTITKYLNYNDLYDSPKNINEALVICSCHDLVLLREAVK